MDFFDRGIKSGWVESFKSVILKMLLEVEIRVGLG